MKQNQMDEFVLNKIILISKFVWIRIPEEKSMITLSKIQIGSAAPVTMVFRSFLVIVWHWDRFWPEINNNNCFEYRETYSLCLNNTLLPKLLSTWHTWCNTILSEMIWCIQGNSRWHKSKRFYTNRPELTQLDLALPIPSLYDLTEPELVRVLIT